MYDMAQHLLREDSTQFEYVSSTANLAAQIEHATNSLHADKIVLAQNLQIQDAEQLLQGIASHFGLLENLRLQASFANFLGHRHRISETFMSVNRRGDYQIVPPHSEGDSFTRLQLAAFYCIENGTNGGESILFNVNDSSSIWESLRERLTKLAFGSRPLSESEWQRSRVLYHLKSAMPASRNDLIVQERDSHLDGVRLTDVLVRLERSRSKLLGRPVYVYWDNVASIDHASWSWFASFLERGGIVRPGPDHPSNDTLDAAAHRRVWSSKVDHGPLFRSYVARKLAPGELMVLNNLTWAHATTGWTPSSAVRNVAAAFA